jgi:hypothetical protein
VRLVLRNQPVARYEDPLAWEVRDPALAKAASGTIAYDRAGDVAFTPAADGVYLVGLSAGSCAYRVLESSVPVGFYAGGPLHVIRGAERLYFHVPDDLDQFMLSARGSGAETVRVNVFDAEGRPAATGQTTPDEETVEIAVPLGSRPGGVWSLELARAEEGVLEDASITLGPGLAPILSLVPQHVFSVGR